MLISICSFPKKNDSQFASWEALLRTLHCDIFNKNNPLLYGMSTGKLNAAGKRWESELCD